MQITLDIKQSSDLQILLPLFKRLGISVHQTLKSTRTGLIPDESENIKGIQNSKIPWDFNLFYGSVDMGLSLEEIDKELKQLREE